MIHTRQTRNIARHTHQRGQAMVEFAVIALLLILLIAGGIELGIAAFNSSRTSEGAKAAANEWLQHLAEYAVHVEDDGGQYVLRKTILDEDENEVVVSVGLGNHFDPANFANPSCLPDGSYSDGILLKEDPLTGVGFKYLYNPLPIDITDCTGNDELEAEYGSASRSRLSVLLNGHSQGVRDAYTNGDIDEEPFPGLPRIHQAIYSQYERVCIDDVGIIMNCKDFNASNGHRMLLKLPGVLLDEYGEPPNDPAMSMSRLARIKYDADTERFESHVHPSVAGTGYVLYPTFHIQCSPQGEELSADPTDPFPGNCDTPQQPQQICWLDDETPLACNVRIVTRYRHTFETFIGMTMAEGKDPMASIGDSLDASFFDYNGTAPHTLGSGLQLGNRGFAPKPYRDLIGCHETKTYGVASSNYLTGFNTNSCY